MDIWLWGKNKGIPSIFFPQKEFVKKGHEVYFLCPLKENEEKYSIASGVHIHRFDFPFNVKRNIYRQKSSFFSRLRGTILNNLNWCFFQVYGFFVSLRIALHVRPDIVYAHSPKSVFVGYLISKIVSAKFIVRLYGGGQLYRRYRSFWHRLKWFREYIVFKVPVDYFIVTNDGSNAYMLAQKLGVDDKKIKEWRNGMDERMYEPNLSAKDEICKRLDINPDSKIIASTCRLISDYGADKLLGVLVVVFERDKDAVCVIAGSGPDEAKLKAFVKENNISSRVFFLGIVEREMIKKLLNASDIFVLLARYHNCTNTMWEAMACGKCIVTTETEAIKEVLTSEKDAILVPHNRLDNTAGILQELLNNDNLRKRLGDNARKRGKDILEPWSKRVEKEAQLLEDLIKNKRQK